MKDDTYTCENLVDLTQFENSEIFYKFKVTDVAGNSKESKKINLKVDSTPPIILEANYSISGRKVTFSIKLNETNFNKVEYFDQKNFNADTKTLCSKLDTQNVCSKTILFKQGSYNLSLIASDKAGSNTPVAGDFAFTII